MLSAWILIFAGFSIVQPRELGMFATKEACEHAVIEAEKSNYRVKKALVCVHNGGKES